ncbi:hypothetical protein MY5147_004055 [Beauveria neobassiana]
MTGRTTRSMQPTASSPPPPGDFVAGSASIPVHADNLPSGTTAVADLSAGAAMPSSVLSEPVDVATGPPWKSGDLEADQLAQLQALAKQSRARKRGRIIAQLQAGEDVDVPVELLREPDTGTKRGRKESWGKFHAKAPKFGARSWVEYQTFMTTLEAIFQSNSSDFATVKQKVIYASLCLTGDTQHRWVAYFQRDCGGDYANLRDWQHFRNWAAAEVGDERTRCLEAFSQLDSTYQAENEPFRDFIHRWEAKELELGNRLDGMLRIAFVFQRLQPGLSRDIEAGGAPETWAELKRRGFAAELRRSQQRRGRGRRDRTTGTGGWLATPYTGNSGRSTQEKTEETPRRGDDNATTPRTGGQNGLLCWKCGGHHYRADCTAPNCQVCASSTHTTGRHRQPKEDVAYPRGSPREPATEPNTVNLSTIRAARRLHATALEGALVRTVKTRRDGHNISAKAVIDSGADHNMIHCRLVRDAILEPAEPLRSAFENATYMPLGITHRMVQFRDDWGRAKWWRIRFVVADLGADDMLLGIPWLRDADPHISWKHNHINYPLEAGDMEIVAGTRRIRDSIASARYLMVPVWQQSEVDGIANQERPIRRTAIGQEAGASSESAATEPRELGPPFPTIPTEYADLHEVFSEEGAAAMPPLDGPRHAIDLEDGATPPWGPIYPLAEKELRELHDFVEEALRRGWIRRSTSPGGAPVLFVPKKGESRRVAADKRNDRLQGAKVFTKIDLKDAYRRIRIREGDEWKTAFRCRYGHFEYTVMPFGLTNAPATFQEYVNETLHGLIDFSCIAYLDDILIYSEDPAAHTQHVREVLERLLNAGLYANLAKCEFGITTVTFLGFGVSPEGVHMERSRIEDIAAWPLPRSVKEVQAFIGFANFYRRFIRNFSRIVKPLTDISRVGRTGPITLDHEQIAAFERLKRAFQEGPILA